MSESSSINHPLQCRCGTVRGYVAQAKRANRGLCYCVDCQAYAHFLGQGSSILDIHGGSQVVATQPRFVYFDSGVDAIRCMSLSERGLLRWYAGCCHTPIGNTPRDRKVAYVGLLHSCLVAQPAQLDAAFGSVKVVLNTQSAKGDVASTPLRNAAAIVRLGTALLRARWSGSYRSNPFFMADGVPIKPAQVLMQAERAALSARL